MQRASFRNHAGDQRGEEGASPVQEGASPARLLSLFTIFLPRLECHPEPQRFLCTGTDGYREREDIELLTAVYGCLLQLSY